MSQLIARYPVLSLVPSPVLATSLLNGKQLRLRIEFTYTGPSTVEVTTIPKWNTSSILTRLTDLLTKLRYLAQPHATYAVEISECGSVRLTVNDDAAPNNPLFLRFMGTAYSKLKDYLKRLSFELHTLGIAENMPDCVEALLEDWLHRLHALKKFNLMQPGQLRIRVGCSDCLVRRFVGATLQTESRGIKANLIAGVARDDYERGFNQYFGGTWDWSQIVVGFPTPHEQLLYAPTLHELLEAALNALLLRSDGRSIQNFLRTMFVGTHPNSNINT